MAKQQRLARALADAADHGKQYSSEGHRRDSALVAPGMGPCIPVQPVPPVC